MFFISELQLVSIKLQDYLLDFETFSEEVEDCLRTHGRPGRLKEAELVTSKGGAGLARIKHD